MVWKLLDLINKEVVISGTWKSHKSRVGGKISNNIFSRTGSISQNFDLTQRLASISYLNSAGIPHCYLMNRVNHAIGQGHGKGPSEDSIGDDLHLALLIETLPVNTQPIASCLGDALLDYHAIEIEGIALEFRLESVDSGPIAQLESCVNSQDFVAS